MVIKMWEVSSHTPLAVAKRNLSVLQGSVSIEMQSVRCMSVLTSLMWWWISRESSPRLLAAPSLLETPFAAHCNFVMIWRITLPPGHLLTSMIRCILSSPSHCAYDKFFHSSYLLWISDHSPPPCQAPDECNTIFTELLLSFWDAHVVEYAFGSSCRDPARDATVSLMRLTVLQINTSTLYSGEISKWSILILNLSLSFSLYNNGFFYLGSTYWCYIKTIFVSTCMILLYFVDYTHMCIMGSLTLWKKYHPYPDFLS